MCNFYEKLGRKMCIFIKKLGWKTCLSGKLIKYLKIGCMNPIINLLL